MTRDEILELMAKAVRDNLSLTDTAIVYRAMLAEPKRMIAYIAAAAHKGRTWEAQEFAAYMLQCAKRVLAGGES